MAGCFTIASASAVGIPLVCGVLLRHARNGRAAVNHGGGLFGLLRFRHYVSGTSLKIAGA